MLLQKHTGKEEGGENPLGSGRDVAELLELGHFADFQSDEEPGPSNLGC